MLCEMARIDLASLRSAGYAPTDDEVVRLNDLAIRIEQGKHTTCANAPRSALCGNIVLHEPTVGALEWWHEFGRDAAWTVRGQMDVYFFALAHARDLDMLHALTSPHSIRRAVRMWRRTVAATEAELWRGLLWVKRAESVAEPPGGDKPQTGDETLDRLAMIVIAAAGAVGVAPDALRTETPTRLVALIKAAQRQGASPIKTSVAKDYIAYQMLVKDIEKRGRKDADNG